MLKRIEFGFGLSFDKDNKAIPIDQADSGARSILFEVAVQFGGGNLVYGLGSWDSGKGIIVERSATIAADIADGITLDAMRDKVHAVVHRIKQVLNQQAVHVVVMRIDNGSSENI